MAAIIQARLPEHRAVLLGLFTEYLRWTATRCAEEYDFRFDPDALAEATMAEIAHFLPPAGYLLLAEQGDAVAGCACTRIIGEHVAELKRMFVRPAFRRQGIGRQLMTASIEEARRQGCAAYRLDSTRFMHAAHALYRSFGFVEIPPYSESEIPVELQRHWVFMELRL